MRRPVEEQIRQLDWPKPSAELRARILKDADIGPARIAWSDRLWFSRTFRWSVAAAVVAMVVVDATSRPSVAGAVQPAKSAATARAMEEIGVPADFARSLVKRTDVARAAETRKAIQTDGGGDQ